MTLKRGDEFLADFLSDAQVDENIKQNTGLNVVENKKNNPFEKLEQRMNIMQGSTKFPAKKEIKEIKNEIIEAIDNTKDIIKSDEDSFEDKVFIQEKLKIVIIKLENQMDNLENSLLIGAEARMYDTFAGMAKTLLDALTKLMDLQKMVQTSLLSMQQPPPASASSKGVVFEEKVTRKISASNFQDVLDEL